MSVRCLCDVCAMSVRCLCDVCAMIERELDERVGKGWISYAQ
jgi:hypothetical protein